MSARGEMLSRQQERALVALLGSPSIKLAARAAGCSSRTLRRWLEKPDFAARFRRARAANVEAAVGQLQRAAMDAVDTLRRLATDRRAPPHAQIRAARAVLDMGFRGSALIDLAERIAEVERLLQEVTGGDATSKT